MEPPPKPPSASLFQVYLRLRPAPTPAQPSLYPQLSAPERFLTVEPISKEDELPTHITIHPPSESRKRAVEKFAFTKVFEEDTSQLEIFNSTGAVPLVEGVLDEGRDGLLATLGVTGSGKSHTILGSKTQRGMTQLCLDLVFRSLKAKALHPATSPSLITSLAAADASEAQILPASGFLDGVFGDVMPERGMSRAATPMVVGNKSSIVTKKENTGLYKQWELLGLRERTVSVDGKKETKNIPAREKASITRRRKNSIEAQESDSDQKEPFVVPVSGATHLLRSRSKTKMHSCNQQEVPNIQHPTPRRNIHRPSALPTHPDITSYKVQTSQNMDYAILVSMYEVYNDRIFDLLCQPKNLKDLRRRPLLFKSTERSPDRKVVAGLRKIVCGSYEEAIMVLETGLAERRVAGTGSNSVSSRSHGFFCVEVKKRPRGGMSNAWSGAQLTVVDLAGSERARNAKTAGATLAEAGKINESLMYLGQCLQMQSDAGDGSKAVVPFRQCKLTELLFSNSFPSAHHTNIYGSNHHRNAQKAVMIVTADPVGDFNATSQILRYSALAREVTVPRIPSISSTILKGVSNLNLGGTGHNTPEISVAELEIANAEAERLNDEVEILALRLAEEQLRRKEAEELWQRAEERAEQIEREVREECWSEMEKRVEEERRRWIRTWNEEADRNDEHLDRKLEILSRGIQIHEDPAPTDSQRVEELEAENASLLRRLESLERELQCCSPTKSTKTMPPLGPSDHAKENIAVKLQGLAIEPQEVGTTANKTPGRKVRKLTPRFPPLGGEEDVFGSV